MRTHLPCLLLLTACGGPIEEEATESSSIAGGRCPVTTLTAADIPDVSTSLAGTIPRWVNDSDDARFIWVGRNAAKLNLPPGSCVSILDAVVAGDARIRIWDESVCPANFAWSETLPTGRPITDCTVPFERTVLLRGTASREQLQMLTFADIDLILDFRGGPDSAYVWGARRFFGAGGAGNDDLYLNYARLWGAMYGQGGNDELIASYASLDAISAVFGGPGNDHVISWTDRCFAAGQDGDDELAIGNPFCFLDFMHGGPGTDVCHDQEVFQSQGVACEIRVD